MTLGIIDYEWPFEWFNPLRPHNIGVDPNFKPRKPPLKKFPESTPDQVNRIERDQLERVPTPVGPVMMSL